MNTPNKGRHAPSPSSKNASTGRHSQPLGTAGKNTSRKRKKKGLSAGAIVCLILGIILLLLLAVYLVFFHFYSSMNIRRGPVAVSEAYEFAEESEFFFAGEDVDMNAEVLSQEDQAALDAALENRTQSVEFPNNENVYNILLLGNDTRGSGVNERTDAMVLVSINKDTRQIVMSSFLRDIYAYIPGWGNNRLNAANVFGGPELTVQTIEQNFGVDIDNYAQVNFYAFIDIVDILGGVDVELSNSEIREMNEKMQEVNWFMHKNDAYLYDHNISGGAGSYHLDGAQTLAYCRVRYADSDFGRTERQRIVLEQIWSKAKAMSLTEATNLLGQILPQVTTDLSQTDCLGLLASALQMLNYEMKALHIPSDNSYSLAMINGMSVLSIDMDSNSQLLQDSIYGP